MMNPNGRRPLHKQRMLCEFVSIASGIEMLLVTLVLLCVVASPLATADFAIYLLGQVGALIAQAVGS